MASSRGFSSTGKAGGGKGSTGKRSQGSGDRIQQRMANSGTAGGRGVNQTGAPIAAARTNGKVKGANVRLGGSPRPGKLP